MDRRFLTDIPGSGAAPNYSQAVAMGDLIFVSGQIAPDHPDWPPEGGTVEAETEACLDLCARRLAGLGAALRDVVKVTVFITDLDGADEMERAYGRYFSGRERPARTCVEVRRLFSGARIEIECIAVRCCAP
jgi:2-iminobutanoate/2-iminopropanoate deaminase